MAKQSAMKAISTLLLLVLFLNVSGQDSPTEFAPLIKADSNWVFLKVPDTTQGSLILSNCSGCMVQARPAIHVKTSYIESGKIYIRSWNRAWIFGKIKYHYSLPKKTWVLIDFIPCK